MEGWRRQGAEATPGASPEMGEREGVEREHISYII